MGENIHTIWIGALFVMIPLVIPLTQNTGLAILQALNIHKGRAIILFYSSLVCVILGYFLSQFFGPMGMFIGTSISLIVGILLINASTNFLLNSLIFSIIIIPLMLYYDINTYLVNHFLINHK